MTEAERVQARLVDLREERAGLVALVGKRALHPIERERMQELPHEINALCMALDSK